MKYKAAIFDYSVGERKGQRRKPYPDSVYAVLEFFDISKDEAVYIGDSEVDYMTAKNAGLDVIMVDWGFRDEAALRSPVTIGNYVDSDMAVRPVIRVRY